MNIKSILLRIKGLISGIAPDAKAILYGSQARGDANINSDIDLLILLPDSYNNKEFTNIHDLISDSLYYLSLELKVDISPLILRRNIFISKKTPFTLNILNEGVEL